MTSDSTPPRAPTLSVAAFLDGLLAARIPPEAAARLAGAEAEIAEGASSSRFAALLSQASRYVKKVPLAPTDAELAEAQELVGDWTPERWTLLDAARVRLVLARTDLDTEAAVAALEEAFRYADVGELCALYRSLALLPDPARFAWRAGEGARSNMRVVFEAACCDTPYPARFFDDGAWRQAAIKALFVGAPLWRLRGLDRRIDAELARMALDLAEERESAGRRVFPELFLCLGTEGGERGLALTLRLLANGDLDQRRAAILALARAGERERLNALVPNSDHPSGTGDPHAALLFETRREALAGRCDQTAFAPLGADAAHPA